MYVVPPYGGKTSHKPSQLMLLYSTSQPEEQTNISNFPGTEGGLNCPPPSKRPHLDYEDHLSAPLNLSAGGQHQLVPTGISLTYPVTTHQGTTYCTLEQVRYVRSIKNL